MLGETGQRKVTGQGLHGHLKWGKKRRVCVCSCVRVFLYEGAGVYGKTGKK